MPQDALLDPQGKTIENNTEKLGIEDISNIRVGKCISLEINSNNEIAAKKTIEEICEKLLVNQITDFHQLVKCSLKGLLKTLS